MNETTPPQRIFMANDLSARCDRALARAAQLAQAWHGKLTVVHVVHAAEVAARDRLASGAPSWASRASSPSLNVNTSIFAAAIAALLSTVHAADGRSAVNHSTAIECATSS